MLTIYTVSVSVLAFLIHFCNVHKSGICINISFIKCAFWRWFIDIHWCEIDSWNHSNREQISLLPCLKIFKVLAFNCYRLSLMALSDQYQFDTVMLLNYITLRQLGYGSMKVISFKFTSTFYDCTFSEKM